MYKGQRVRVVGQRLYFRPRQETKQEFFVHVFAHIVMETLGDDWD